MVIHPESRFLCSTGTRRKFLIASASLAAASVWSSRAVGVVKQNVKLSEQPFQLGVAAGDPASDGFVIWTRLAPRPLEGGGMPGEAVSVAWQVAEDEGMKKVVKKGTTAANPEWAHSVHVEVAGLAPDRWYWYQFKAGSEVKKDDVVLKFDSSLARQQLAEMLAAHNYNQDAADQYRALVTLKPDNRDFHRAYGRVLIKVGKIDLSTLREACETFDCQSNRPHA
jgi:phosphodiesterase/alkaline phosphatase D-like protein